MADLQTSVEWHSKLLAATGGKLELPKCFYYPIFWKFTAQGKPVLDIPNEAAPRLQIQELQISEPTIIPMKLPTEPHKTLGVHIAPDGNQADQIKALTTKVRDFTAKL